MPSLESIWNTVVALIDPLVISATVGAVVGALLSFLLMWILYDKNFKREKRIELAEKRLEKLYSPLYSFINSEAVAMELIDFSARGNLMEVIENNIHLASDELRPFLKRWLETTVDGVDMENQYPGDPENMCELIESEWKKLRKELEVSDKSKLKQYRVRLRGYFR